MRASLAVTLAVAAVGAACATPGHAQSTPPVTAEIVPALVDR